MCEKPLVVCLTNTVAANFTANVLLAVGAKPAMVEEPSEAAELAAAADAVLINVGTLTATQSEAMRAAIHACRRGTDPDTQGTDPCGIRGTDPGKAGSVPWVLDPVACQALAYRRTAVLDFLADKPTVLRGNHDEIEFLLGSVPHLLGSVPSLATGAEDIIREGQSVVARVTGGVSMLQTVTATGCAQGALCAAFLGRGQTPVAALLAASRLMKRAGEKAWERAQTPGSFQVALLDALGELSETQGELSETFS